MEMGNGAADGGGSIFLPPDSGAIAPVPGVHRREDGSVPACVRPLPETRHRPFGVGSGEAAAGEAGMTVRAPGAGREPG